MKGEPLPQPPALSWRPSLNGGSAAGGVDYAVTADGKLATFDEYGPAYIYRDTSFTGTGNIGAGSGRDEADAWGTEEIQFETIEGVQTFTVNGEVYQIIDNSMSPELPNYQP